MWHIVIKKDYAINDNVRHKLQTYELVKPTPPPQKYYIIII